MLYIILAEGFEEIEAFTTIDILRRLDIDIQTVSVTGARQVRGAHGICVMTDMLMRITDLTKGDGIILPGGMPGAENLRKQNILRRAIKTLHANGKLVAAICAAPMVLGVCEILQGKRATCYPGFESELLGAKYTDEMVVCDENIITAKGPGASAEFAFAIARNFVSEEDIDKVRSGMFIA